MTEIEYRKNMTNEEVAQLVNDYLEKIKNNICPICGKEIKRKYKLGRCVYAAPCQDRLYQGGL